MSDRLKIEGNACECLTGDQTCFFKNDDKSFPGTTLYRVDFYSIYHNMLGHLSVFLWPIILQCGERQHNDGSLDAGKSHLAAFEVLVIFVYTCLTIKHSWHNEKEEQEAGG